MADSKISELTALTGAIVASDDLFHIIDTSANENKKITASELQTYLNKEATIYRLISIISTVDEDPIGIGGGDWECADDTTGESFYGVSATSLVAESNGIFTLQQTGYFLVLFNTYGASLDSYIASIFIDTGSGYNEIARHGVGPMGGTTEIGVGSCMALIKTSTTATDNKIKTTIDFTGSAVQLVGNADYNTTHILFLKLADL